MEKKLTRKVEDYLESILEIVEINEYARTKDIAMLMRVKPPSVVEMIGKLDRMGLVIYRKYNGVTLTYQGEKIAREIRDRHESIRTMLEIIRVPKDIASKDACIMEHELEPETINQIRNFVSFMNIDGENDEWLEKFEIFCKISNTNVK
ncbi:MAG: metal-dependent transcriptional regulator [Methanosarcinales archaeon]|jgi:DtxR family Mn-dependent transcriptional regulator|nr:metal-dependent transcriptional regulator [Methanosarcinales archaeon]